MTSSAHTEPSPAAYASSSASALGDCSRRCPPPPPPPEQLLSAISAVSAATLTAKHRAHCASIFSASPFGTRSC